MGGVYYYNCSKYYYLLHPSRVVAATAWLEVAVAVVAESNATYISQHNSRTLLQRSGIVQFGRNNPSTSIVVIKREVKPAYYSDRNLITTTSKPAERENSSQSARLRRLKAKMRLLNTSTFTLKEFVDDNIPRYAILSHRWRDGEVTFQDLHDIQDGRIVGKEGWAKIQGCCWQGFKDGLEWVWIDSCCIDKTSSAELSEAINSMFSWY
jgi:hypothetical protein